MNGSELEIYICEEAKTAEKCSSIFVRILGYHLLGRRQSLFVFCFLLLTISSKNALISGQVTQKALSPLSLSPKSPKKVGTLSLLFEPRSCI